MEDVRAALLHYAWPHTSPKLSPPSIPHVKATDLLQCSEDGLPAAATVRSDRHGARSVTDLQMNAPSLIYHTTHYTFVMTRLVLPDKHEISAGDEEICDQSTPSSNPELHEKSKAYLNKG
jgi:hypothetical protein